MAVEIEQGEVFAARRQRFVPIEPLMIHTHDTLVAPVEFAEPVPSLDGLGLCRPDPSSTSLACDLEAASAPGFSGPAPFPGYLLFGSSPFSL